MPHSNQNNTINMDGSLLMLDRQLCSVKRNFNYIYQRHFGAIIYKMILIKRGVYIMSSLNLSICSNIYMYSNLLIVYFYNVLNDGCHSSSGQK